MKREIIKGLIAAPFTPFKDNGSLNMELIPILVDKLVNDGLIGAFICGSNGEGPNMTTQERKLVAEAFVKAANNRIKIWVHVGHASIEESKQLIKHAYEIGADAASSVAAFYFKPTSEENLVACIKEIASAAPEIPFYYYHIPSLTGVNIDMLKFIALAKEAIPNLQGIKYTANTIWEYQACVQKYGEEYNILYGYDEMLLPALAVGAQAAIGSTYNFAACGYLKVIDEFNKGNMDNARNHMNQMIDMVRMLVRYPPIPAQKAIMKMLGYNVGGCRLPLQTLNEESYNSLFNQLDSVGFWKYLKND
jgi:N-acetylneuraminate lyase